MELARGTALTRTSRVAPLMLAFLGTIWNDYRCAAVPVMENYGVIQAKRGEGELSRGRVGASDMEVGAGNQGGGSPLSKTEEEGARKENASVTFVVFFYAKLEHEMQLL